MNYSFATVLTTILASNLVIILTAFCFRFEKVLLTVGYRLLAVFLTLTLIRFAFPFELPFTKSIYLPESASAALSFLRQPLFGQDTISTPYTPVVSLVFLLQCLWLTGCCIKLSQHIKDYLFISRFIRRKGCDISQTTPVRTVLKDICGKRHKRFHVVTLSGIKTPQIFGIFSPYILIPESAALSQEDWCFVLQHEAFHYFHHDLLIKEAVNLLCILYWWNPACTILQKQVELLLEMHVDDSLSHGDPTTIRSYLNTLLRIAESTANDTPVLSKSLTVSLVGEDEDELVKRFQMLCRKSSSLQFPLFLGILTVVVSVYACSYLLILESSTDYMVKHTSGTLGLTDGFFAVPTPSGTYNIYYNDILIETVDNLKYYREIPVLPVE